MFPSSSKTRACVDGRGMYAKIFKKVKQIFQNKFTDIFPLNLLPGSSLSLGQQTVTAFFQLTSRNNVYLKYLLQIQQILWISKWIDINESVYHCKLVPWRQGIRTPTLGIPGRATGKLKEKLDLIFALMYLFRTFWDFVSFDHPSFPCQK